MTLVLFVWSMHPVEYVYEAPVFHSYNLSLFPLTFTVVALGLFTVTISGPFSAYFQFSFFFHFSKMNQKMIIFAKWSTPICKDGHFCFHFAFILPSFCHSIFVVISNSALTPMCNCPHTSTTVHIDS